MVGRDLLTFQTVILYGTMVQVGRIRQDFLMVSKRPFGLFLASVHALNFIDLLSHVCQSTFAILLPKQVPECL